MDPEFSTSTDEQARRAYRRAIRRHAAGNPARSGTLPAAG